MEPPRLACNKTKNCRLAGGCMDCQLEKSQDAAPDWIAVFEWNRDREVDLEAFGTPLPKDYPRRF
jgi:hypothetical protein